MKKAKTQSDVPARFERIADEFLGAVRVTRGTEKGFGLGALKVNGRIFAMVTSKGEAVMKVPAKRASDLVQSGRAQFFSTRPGRIMKEWIVPGDELDWTGLAREAFVFVGQSAPRPGSTAGRKRP